MTQIQQQPQRSNLEALGVTIPFNVCNAGMPSKVTRIRAYVSPDTALPRIPQRGATPAHHPYCILSDYWQPSPTSHLRRVVSNIPNKRSAERIAALIRNGEDPAVAAFNVLG
jgi:hypothetical protein